MTKKQKRWMYAPSKAAAPKVATAEKAAIKVKADELVETALKPKHIKPPPEEPRFNYVVDIYTKWYRHYLYFCATYHVPGPNAISPSFESKFARLEYVDKDRYHLAYMRYTGQWWELYQNLSLAECLRAIEDEPHFMP